MTKKSRYSLLLAGFIIFVVLAPLIVLYVRGESYNFKTHSFVATGIFGIQAQPKSVDIFLDGVEKRSSAGDIKFVPAGEYQLTLKKSGYQSWSKRLAITAGQVTWANPANNYIYLLLSAPAAKTLDQTVLDFYGTPDNFVYLTGSDITIGSTHYSLPENADKILAHDAGNKNFVLEGASTSPQTLLYFNSDSGNFTDLSVLFSTMPQMQFSGSGDLFALSAGNLYTVDAANKIKTPIFQNVKAFYAQGNDLYYIQEKLGALSLFVSQEPFAQSQTLLTTAPNFQSGNLIVTFEKKIFLEADNSLYEDTGTFEQISNNVANFNFDPNTSILSFFHSGEFDYIDSNQNLNFITRTGQSLNNLAINTNIGYAFYSTNSQLTAIELDTRSNQNQYVLYTGTNIEKFSVDSSGQNILVMDDGELKSLKIR